MDRPSNEANGVECGGDDEEEAVSESESVADVLPFVLASMAACRRGDRENQGGGVMFAKGECTGFRRAEVVSALALFEFETNGIGFCAIIDTSLVSSEGKIANFARDDDVDVGDASSTVDKGSFDEDTESDAELVG